MTDYSMERQKKEEGMKMGGRGGEEKGGTRRRGRGRARDKKGGRGGKDKKGGREG